MGRGALLVGGTSTAWWQMVGGSEMMHRGLLSLAMVLRRVFSRCKMADGDAWEVDILLSVELMDR